MSYYCIQNMSVLCSLFLRYTAPGQRTLCGYHSFQLVSSISSNNIFYSVVFSCLLLCIWLGLLFGWLFLCFFFFCICCVYYMVSVDGVTFCICCLPMCVRPEMIMPRALCCLLSFLSVFAQQIVFLIC